MESEKVSRMKVIKGGQLAMRKKWSHVCPNNVEQINKSYSTIVKSLDPGSEKAWVQIMN